MTSTVLNPRDQFLDLSPHVRPPIESFPRGSVSISRTTNQPTGLPTSEKLPSLGLKKAVSKGVTSSSEAMNVNQYTLI